MTTSLLVSSLDVPVKDVVIYPDCAIITRQWVSSLENDTTVILKNLPGLVDSNLLRVSVNCNAALIKDVIISDPSELENNVEDVKQRSLKLATAIAEMEKDSITAQREIVHAQEQWSAWNNYCNNFKQGNASVCFDEGSATSFAKFLKIYYKECKTIEKTILDQEKYYHELQDSIAEYQQQLNTNAEEVRKASGKNLAVSIAMPDQGEINLTVTYKMEHVKWIPKYDMRLNLQEQVLEISYHAVIQQNSGEDWKNVHVTLANIVPQSPGTIPIEFQNVDSQPSKLRSEMSSTSSLSGLLNGTCAEATCNNPEIRLNGSTMHAFDSSHQSMVYQVEASPLTISPEQKINVPGDNSETSIKATSFTSPVQIIHKCIPNISPHVYIHLTGLNVSNYSLLPGTAKVYLSGAFLTTIEVSVVNSFEAFEFWFGADPEVRITLKPPVRSRKGKGSAQFDTYVCGYQIENDTTEHISVMALWDSHLADKYAEFVSIDELEGPPAVRLGLQNITLTPQNQMKWQAKIPPQTKHKIPLLLKYYQSPVIEETRKITAISDDTSSIDTHVSKDPSCGRTEEQKPKKLGTAGWDAEEAVFEKRPSDVASGGTPLPAKKGFNMFKKDAKY